MAKLSTPEETDDSTTRRSKDLLPASWEWRDRGTERTRTGGPGGRRDWGPGQVRDWSVVLGRCYLRREGVSGSSSSLSVGGNYGSMMCGPSCVYRVVGVSVPDSVCPMGIQYLPLSLVRDVTGVESHAEEEPWTTPTRPRRGQQWCRRVLPRGSRTRGQEGVGRRPHSEDSSLGQGYRVSYLTFEESPLPFRHPRCADGRVGPRVVGTWCVTRRPRDQGPSTLKGPLVERESGRDGPSTLRGLN